VHPLDVMIIFYFYPASDVIRREFYRKSVGH
jgi:hypothetical protein